MPAALMIIVNKAGDFCYRQEKNGDKSMKNNSLSNIK